MRRKTVHTKRLTLRALRASDYKIWFQTHTEHFPAFDKWDIGPKNKKECTRAWFKKIKRRHESLALKDQCYIFSIFHRKTGRLVGSLDISVFVRGTHQFANFGYRIYNRYWRKGYGKEAARAGLKIGFQDLKLNRLEAAINLDNRKSIALVRSIGMKREGIKKRYWYEEGQWVDHLIYVANPEDIGLKSRKPFDL